MSLWRVTTLFSGPTVVGGGINQLHFDATGGTAAQARTAVTNFWTTMNDCFRVDTTATVLGEVEEIDGADHVIGITSVGGNDVVPGTDDGAPLPPATQLLCRLRTGVYNSGREIRGRIFVPSLTENLNIAGEAGGTRYAEAVTACTNLRTDANSKLVVWSRTHLVYAEVTSLAPVTKFSVLRSRRD